jgi:hypothetical protein
LTEQRNKRDYAREIAEKSEGKDEEQKRRDVINWRRERAIMKKNWSIQEKNMEYICKWNRL